MFRKVGLILSVVCTVAFCLSGVASAAASQAVVVDVGADLPVVEVGKAQRVVVRVLLEPGIPAVKKRVPLAVALVLDKSGSMNSDGKMENAKRGALEALKKLGTKDIATVVVYDYEASVLVPAKSAGDKSAFTSAISRVRADGSTALYDGVQAGAKQLQSFIKEGYVPRIVLLSDGLANVGPSTTSDLAALGRTLAGREMTVTTIGLGLDYNEDLMTALASESGGNAYFAKTAGMLPDIFVRDMDDALALTARKVRITLTCNGNVQPVRAIGRTGTKKGQTIEVSVDNLYGAEKYALFEIDVPKSDKESVLDAIAVKVDYVDAASGAKASAKAPLKIAYTSDKKKVASNRQADIAAQAELAKNAEVREEAVKLADEGRSKEASKLLKQRAQEVKQAAPAAPAATAPQMESEARYFDSLADSIEASGSITNEQRKENVNEAYKQKNQQAPTPSEKRKN